MTGKTLRLGLAAAIVACMCAAVQRGSGQVVANQELNTRSVRAEESQLACLVADSARAATSADVALITAIAFHEVTLPRGTLDASEVLRCLANPEDTLVLVRLTGEQLRRGLEHALALYPQRNPGFLQVSGLFVIVLYNPAQDVQIVSVKVGKEPLDEKREYTVAMPMPLAHGHLGYARIWDKASILRDTKRTLASAVEEYCSTLRTLSEKPEPRIQIRKAGDR